jgi:hypothetical protein
MAEPIANNWKAIRDRMEQIKSEESASSRPCARCGDRGWVPLYRGGALAVYKTDRICDVCRNPRGLPYPEAFGSDMSGRMLKF